MGWIRILRNVTDTTTLQRDQEDWGEGEGVAEWKD